MLCGWFGEVYLRVVVVGMELGVGGYLKIKVVEFISFGEGI